MMQGRAEWDFYETEADGHPARIALDFALADTAPDPEQTFLLWFSLKLQAPDANGYPTATEERLVDELEQQLLEELQMLDPVLAGRVAHAGAVDLYFYAAEKDQFEDVVLEVMEQYPDYAYATETAKDRGWDTYLGQLYPGYYDYQCMLNRQVIAELQAEGDKPEMRRPVDHLLSFKTEQGRSGFQKAAGELGYRTLSAGKPDKGAAMPYPLHIVRDDQTQPGHLNALIWTLCELAVAHNGHYDGWGCDTVK